MIFLLLACSNYNFRLQNKLTFSPLYVKIICIFIFIYLQLTFSCKGDKPLIQKLLNAFIVIVNSCNPFIQYKLMN